MFKKAEILEHLDPEIWKQIINELKRQQQHIELIASENYTSPAVMEAQGSVLLTNMLKAILEKDITEVVSLSRLPARLLIDLKNSMVLNMQMFNLTQELKLMELYF